MRLTGSLLVSAALLAAVVAVPPPEAAALPAPVHTLTVTGDGVDTWPAFDPGIERYAVTTTEATSGTLTVRAATSDPAGVVRVDGRVAPGGVATVSGLVAGDEVSVFIQDSAGTEVHALVYLPVGFPELEVTTREPGLEAGQVGLTLSSVIAGGPRFVTAVDRNGVPAHVLAAGDVFDLKDQPDGHLSYSTTTTTPGRTGDRVVVLDEAWREVASHETVAGLVNTDAHDSILLPDGTRWLMAYEPDGTGQIDSVIQEIGPDGQERFRWSSDGLQDESVGARPTNGAPWDYAHLNSIQLLPGGDLIASFRHLDAVFRIATTAHDGWEPGDVVWRFGGRESDFTFPDDPYGGPCAQHTASVLPDGHVLVFDDGSGLLAGDLCVDPDDPDGPPVARTQSRAAEWSLDLETGEASLVWSEEPDGWYSWFMGSATRLPHGNTLIGWAAELRALATEVSPEGDLLWQLRVADPKPSPPPISYRAALLRGRDVEPPTVEVTSPADGAHVAYGAPLTADFSCTDRGGSSLHSCGGDVQPGGAMDTTRPGVHTVRMTGTDGAGNTTTVVRTYTVDATFAPAWVDDRARTVLRHRTVSTRLELVNAGTAPDAFVLSTKAVPRFRVRVEIDGVRLPSGSRTPLVQPGRSIVVDVVVRRTKATRSGDHARVGITAASVGEPARVATASVRVRARLR